MDNSKVPSKNTAVLSCSPMIIILLKKHTQQNLHIFGFTNELFFCACIAIHSKRTFSFKENFFKMRSDESDCDLSSEENDLNEK